jgi:hypothetical protein
MVHKTAPLGKAIKPQSIETLVLLETTVFLEYF